MFCKELWRGGILLININGFHSLSPLLWRERVGVYLSYRIVLRERGEIAPYISFLTCWIVGMINWSGIYGTII
jgi:hypothetical protein